MGGDYILALDQGTTSSRAIIYDRDCRVVGKDQKGFDQIYPHPGWVEHDPEEIWGSVQSAATGAVHGAGLSFEDISAIGITNQRETTVIWNRETGEPICNAIVWQCRRTADLCAELREQGLEAEFRERTGLLLDPYFSGTKIGWILDEVDGARRAAEAGDLLFGTIDSWLVWRLTGGRVHITDLTNASRTLLFNIHDLEWDDRLLELLDLPRGILPGVAGSSEVYGHTDPGGFTRGEIPVAGIAGDQQAASFGQGCFERGMTKITYGTGAFMLMNTGREVVRSGNGLLATIAWGLEDEVTYALEGSIFIAGAALQWLRDELGLLFDVADSEYLARKAGNCGGVYLVPAFSGLGAPYWDAGARGTVVGISRGTRREQFVRAALESLAYQSRDVLEAMGEDSGIALKEIRVDGGAAVNDFLLEFLAGITGAEVERPVDIETTAAGAAHLAGLATGFWKSRGEIMEKRAVDRRFQPVMEEDRREALYRGWRRAVRAARYWSGND